MGELGSIGELSCAASSELISRNVHFGWAQTTPSPRKEYLVALAKSKMLDDHGDPNGADAIIKPYFLVESENAAADAT